MAIKVAAKLKESGFNCDLCMVGPDGDGSFLFAKKLARDLKIDVSLKGKMNKLDWIQLSTDFNIFLNTTNFDNMPVSVIEVMALGFPIVSTNVGGIPNLIENGVDGLLVDKNDVDVMASQIIRLKNNPDLVKKLTINARKKAEEFDWQEVKAKWNNLFINKKH
jgi:glycosyltransferase involved in cell wall biosynthesis